MKKNISFLLKQKSRVQTRSFFKFLYSEVKTKLDLKIPTGIKRKQTYMTTKGWEPRSRPKPKQPAVKTKLDYSCDWKRDPKEVDSPRIIRVRNDTSLLSLYMPVPQFNQSMKHLFLIE